LAGDAAPPPVHCLLLVGHLSKRIMGAVQFKSAWFSNSRRDFYGCLDTSSTVQVSLESLN
jgi:hypothetical protein